MAHPIIVATAPASEPISLGEAKVHARVDHSDEDDLINSAISAAREYVEDYIRRKLITQTLRMKIDWTFPGVIELPFPPVQSVTAAAFTYVDTNGDTTQVDTDVYTVDTQSQPGLVFEAYNQTWPTVRIQRQAVSIDWIAGYGDDPEDVPFQLRQAVLMMTTHMYEARQPHVLTIGGAIVDIPKTVDDLLQPYVVHF